MIVVCAMNQKGGAGKTTLLLHLLIVAWLRGLVATLIDLDPQRSAEKWSALREERLAKDQPVVLHALVDDLSAVLEEARARHVDLVLLDAPGAIDKRMIYSAAAADVIVVPTRTSQLDLDALEETLLTLKHMRALDKVVVVINAPRPKDAKAKVDRKERMDRDEVAVRALVETRFGAVMAPFVIGDLPDLSRSLDGGQGIAEVAPKSAAARTMTKLLDWVLERGRMSVVPLKRGVA